MKCPPSALLLAVPALFLASTLVGCGAPVDLDQVQNEKGVKDNTNGDDNGDDNEPGIACKDFPKPRPHDTTIDVLPPDHTEPPPSPEESLLDLFNPRSESVTFQEGRSIPSCNGFQTIFEFDASGVVFVTAKSCSAEFSGANGAFDAVEKFKVSAPTAVHDLVQYLNNISQPQVTSAVECSTLPGVPGEARYSLLHTKEGITRSFDGMRSGCGDFARDQAEQTRLDLIEFARVHGEAVAP